MSKKENWEKVYEEYKSNSNLTIEELEGKWKSRDDEYTKKLSKIVDSKSEEYKQLNGERKKCKADFENQKRNLGKYNGIAKNEAKIEKAKSERDKYQSMLDKLLDVHKEEEETIKRRNELEQETQRLDKELEELKYIEEHLRIALKNPITEDKERISKLLTENLTKQELNQHKFYENQKDLKEELKISIKPVSKEEIEQLQQGIKKFNRICELLVEGKSMADIQATLIKPKIEQEEVDQEEIEQEEVDQEEIDQEEIDQEEIDQEEIDQEEIDQEEIDQEEIDQEEIDQEEIDQEEIDQEEINQEEVDQEEINQEEVDQEEVEQVELNKEKATGQEHLRKMYKLIEEQEQYNNTENKEKISEYGGYSRDEIFNFFYSKENYNNMKEIIIDPVIGMATYTYSDNKKLKGRNIEIKYDKASIDNAINILRKNGFNTKNLINAVDPTIVNLIIRDNGLNQKHIKTQIGRYVDTLNNNGDLKINYNLRGIYNSNLDLQTIKRINRIANSAKLLNKESINLQRDNLLNRIIGNIKKKLEDDNVQQLLNSGITKVEEIQKNANKTISRAKTLAISLGKETINGLNLAGTRLKGYFRGENKLKTFEKIRNIKESFVPKVKVDEEQAYRRVIGNKRDEEVIIEDPDGTRRTGRRIWSYENEK